ncbi:MAG: preprotein translocase subunit SecG [Candidatus Buchananbacteria bacterium]
MIIDFIQIASAIGLIIVILMQNRGSGLGSAFGGDGNAYRTKRGIEKSLVKISIVLAIIFFVTAFINFLY